MSEAERKYFAAMLRDIQEFENGTVLTIDLTVTAKYKKIDGKWLLESISETDLPKTVSDEFLSKRYPY